MALDERATCALCLYYIKFDDLKANKILEFTEQTETPKIKCIPLPPGKQDSSFLQICREHSGQKIAQIIFANPKIPSKTIKVRSDVNDLVNYSTRSFEISFHVTL
jgi:hypothetical protein